MFTAHTPAPYGTDGDRWQAVLARDPRADGEFWYAVRSTGVYCRPTCAARRPRRENVAYYHTPAAAASNSYRSAPQSERGRSPAKRPASQATVSAALLRAARMWLPPSSGSHLTAVPRRQSRRA